MARQILTLLDDPEKARQMGLAGRKRVTRVFDKYDLCRRIEGVYKDMLTIKKRNTKGEMYNASYI